jgi:hypothetical protein
MEASKELLWIQFEVVCFYGLFLTELNKEMHHTEKTRKQNQERHASSQSILS